MSSNLISPKSTQKRCSWFESDTFISLHSHYSRSCGLSYHTTQIFFHRHCGSSWPIRSFRAHCWFY